MDVSVTETDAYIFDGFLLDPARRSLSRKGVAITIRPRLFDTLVYLVEHPGRVVEKDELLAAVWSGRTVEEANLRQTIFTLRKTLRANGDAAGCIITAPGRGYRFVATVHATPSTPGLSVVSAACLSNNEPIGSSSGSGFVRSAIRVWRWSRKAFDLAAIAWRGSPSPGVSQTKHATPLHLVCLT